MRRKTMLAAATAVLVCGGAGAIWLLADTPRKMETVDATSVRAATQAPHMPNNNHNQAPVTKRTLPAEPNDNAIAFMLASVADEYTQTTRHPDYSIPLTRAQAEGYQGNRYHPVALPLEGDGQFSVTLDKFRFTRGDPILVVASLTGRQVVGNNLSATLETAADRDTADTTTLKPTGSAGYFDGNLSSDHEPGEYRLIVEASVDGRPVRHASPLTIEPDLGDFEGLGSASIDGNDLVIPVHFNAETSGYYSLSAQLYDNQEPIALLQAETALGTSRNTIDLRAHGSVLANRDIAGALQVRYLQIRQLPARPGDRTHYAFGPDKGYEFSPPDLDKLRDEPAVNPESEHRAMLLQQLADKF
ncbi:hypothetical protein ACNQ6O_08025 [Marinobacter sp. SBS5]|uniref:hypothetical protein n=1 Tax=Marinobacter sp. SBS5 TaxID=3401754 RepID=UPI003AAF928C